MNTYDTDFYRWTQTQAAALRAKDFAALDLGNLAEEIESLGRSDRRAVVSHLERLLLHLLKWREQPQGRGPSWRSTIRHARREIGKLLAESPSLIGVRDPRGRNWLHVCCSVNPKSRGLHAGDAVRTADVLLHAGLDIDEPAFSEGNWRATPLWYAVARGQNLTLARHLLERGAGPNHCLWAAAYRDDLPAIKLLVAAGADVDPVTEDETPFLSAVKRSRFRAAKLLLELGANVDFQDRRGMTALHYMLRKGSDKRHLRMVIARGARLDLADRKGATAAEILRRKRDPALQRLGR